MDEEFIRSKFGDIHCGHCGQLCVQSNIDLLEHNGNFWFFSIYCESCKSHGFLTAVIKDGNETEESIELTGMEIEDLDTPICSDDVLDMYTFLKDFAGDFSGMFSKEKSA